MSAGIRLALALAVAALLAVGVSAAAAASPPAGASTSRTSSTPTLTGSYPLGTRRLSGRHSSTATTAAGRAAAPVRRGSPPSRPAGASARDAGRAGGDSRVLVSVALGLAVLLVLLAIVVLASRRRSAASRSRGVPGRRAPRRARTRHPVPGLVIGLLAPVMRYSAGRDAYVLRLVGGRVGPVLVRPPGARSGTGRPSVYRQPATPSREPRMPAPRRAGPASRPESLGLPARPPRRRSA